MKRTLLAIVATLMMTTSMNAQRLTDIMAEARFITDKMVVELGLTKVQRNNILNLNLTYLDGINSYRDLDARGWHHRNQQIRAMLNDRQWKRFKNCHYFYRPIGWKDNAYVHNIYAKYPRHGRPTPPPPPGFDKPSKPRFDKPGRPEWDKPGRPGFDKPDRPRFDKPGKPDKRFKDDKHFKDDRHDKHFKDRQRFDNDRRNNRFAR